MLCAALPTSSDRSLNSRRSDPQPIPIRIGEKHFSSPRLLEDLRIELRRDRVDAADADVNGRHRSQLSTGVVGVLGEEQSRCSMARNGDERRERRLEAMLPSLS